MRLVSHVVSLLVLSSLLVAPVGAQQHAAVDLESRSWEDRLLSAPQVDPAIVDTLRQQDAALVTVRFYLPEKSDARFAGHPALASDVHPVHYDLVDMAQPGEMFLDDAGFDQALTLSLSAAAISALVERPYVLGITLAHELPGKPQVTARPASKSLCTGVPRSACLQNRIRVSVVHGGLNTNVAANNGTSAAFWTFSPDNWEVVVKVLNGCGINNRFWVFAGRASTASYTVDVRDTQTIQFKTYNNASCPLTDTNAIICNL